MVGMNSHSIGNSMFWFITYLVLECAFLYLVLQNKYVILCAQQLLSCHYQSVGLACSGDKT